MSQGDVSEDEEDGGSQFNREDGSVGNIEEEEEEEKEREGKDSRKRLRVPGKVDQVKKRKKVSKTAAKVQENVKSSNSTAVDGEEVSISTQTF